MSNLWLSSEDTFMGIPWYLLLTLIRFPYPYALGKHRRIAPRSYIFVNIRLCVNTQLILIRKEKLWKERWGRPEGRLPDCTRSIVHSNDTIWWRRFISGAFAVFPWKAAKGTVAKQHRLFEDWIWRRLHCCTTLWWHTQILNFHHLRLASCQLSGSFN